MKFLIIVLLSQFSGSLDWSGRTWEIKHGNGLGPGPNCWDSSFVSVENGDLVLKIGKDSLGRWCSSEVRSTDCVPFDLYELDVPALPNDLDPYAVFGAFLYENDENEIDFEALRAGHAGAPLRGQFVTQPWDAEGNHFPFTLPPGPLKVLILWSYHYLLFNADLYGQTFQTYYCERRGSSPSGYPKCDIPSGCMRLHLNLWQWHGADPSGPQEVRVRSFGAVHE